MDKDYELLELFPKDFILDGYKAAFDDKNNIIYASNLDKIISINLNTKCMKE